MTRDMRALVESLERSWSRQAAGEVLTALLSRVWENEGRIGGDTERLITRMREVIKKRTEKEKDEARREALGFLYLLEQGIGRRDAALGAAREAYNSFLSCADRDVGEELDLIFQLAKAYYWKDRFPEAVEWSRKGALLGRKEFSRLSSPAKRKLGNELVFLGVRMSMMGESPDEIDAVLTEALNILEKEGTREERANALGFWSEIRMFQGRWRESVEYARRSLGAGGYPAAENGVAYALWTGGRSLCRLGAPEEGLAWIEDALRLCREAGDISGTAECLFSKSLACYLLGREADAREAADEAVEKGHALQMRTILEWALLERRWLTVETGGEKELSVEDAEHAVEFFREAGVRVLEAEARYALSFVLFRCGRNGEKERRKANRMFHDLGMEWHEMKGVKSESLWAVKERRNRMIRRYFIGVILSFLIVVNLHGEKDSGYIREEIYDTSVHQDEAAVNVKLVSNRWPDCTTLTTAIHDMFRLEGVERGTDQEKALALWKWFRILMSSTGGNYAYELRDGKWKIVRDPHKIFTVYGHHQCDGLSWAMVPLWRAVHGARLLHVGAYHGRTPVQGRRRGIPVPQLRSPGTLLLLGRREEHRGGAFHAHHDGHGLPPRDHPDTSSQPPDLPAGGREDRAAVGQHRTRGAERQGQNEGLEEQILRVCPRQEAGNIRRRGGRGEDLGGRDRSGMVRFPALRRFAEHGVLPPRGRGSAPSSPEERRDGRVHIPLPSAIRDRGSKGGRGLGETPAGGYVSAFLLRGWKEVARGLRKKGHGS